jgi:NAD-dependent dihydropyrimidine dehydrogenase PreA subunit
LFTVRYSATYTGQWHIQELPDFVMAHTILTDTCEGVADCVEACPVACIHEGPGKNVKGTDWYWIDFATCIDCGICLQVCPVEGAIVPEEQPMLQRTPQ